MPEILESRGTIVEARHPFSMAVARVDGAERCIGDDLTTALRSAAKPFQLATSLEALGDPSVGEDELAVGAASHSGEPEHIAIVERILARFGSSADGLRCGAHAPSHTPSAEAVLRNGRAYSALHNNCSGKHAFMLAASKACGFALDYRPIEHPLQARNARRIAEVSGVTPSWAVDGCGVPTFALPLSAMARSFARIASAMADEGEGSPLEGARLGRIGWAMARRPELTSGTARLDRDVVRKALDPMAVKVGAMGLVCLALPKRRLGIAVKIHSGRTEALPVAVEHALATLAEGAWRHDDGWELGLVRNVVGDLVGRFAVAP